MSKSSLEDTSPSVVLFQPSEMRISDADGDGNVRSFLLWRHSYFVIMMRDGWGEERRGTTQSSFPQVGDIPFLRNYRRRCSFPVIAMNSFEYSVKKFEFISSRLCFLSRR